MSADPGRRNFTLGQEQQNLILRIRAPGNGLNGSRVTAVTDDAPLRNEIVDVWAVYDGDSASIQIDGRCAAIAPVGRSGSLEPVSTAIAVTVIASTALAGLAAASFSPSSRPSRRRWWLLCGSSAIWLLLWLAGCWQHVPHFGSWALALGVASVVAAIPLCDALAKRSEEARSAV